MMWRVIKEFADATDNLHVYRAGDSFPRFGKQVSQSRIDELSTDKNSQKTPLIVAEIDEGEKIKAGVTAKPKRTKVKQKE